MPHFVEMSGEEMIARNEDQFLWFGGLRYNLLQQRVRPVLITIAADEELRLGALAQKLVRIQAAFRFDGRADRDQRFDVGIGTDRAQAGS